MLEHLLSFVNLNPEQPHKPFSGLAGVHDELFRPLCQSLNPNPKSANPYKTLAKPKSDLIQAGAARSVAHPLLELWAHDLGLGAYAGYGLGGLGFRVFLARCLGCSGLTMSAAPRRTLNSIVHGLGFRDDRRSEGVL